MTNRVTTRKLDKYQLVTYVSSDLKKAFRERCEAQGQTVSNALRRFIIEDLNNG